MKKALLLLLFSFQYLLAQETPTLDYYLPKDVTYNKDIPTPEKILGYQVGQWHVTHDKLVEYMRALAEASDRITIETRGTTFETRPLILLTITSAKNHQNLDQIRKDHVALTDNDNTNISQMPAVVYQGFSIHGNEPSGSNAALVAAYYLAAAQGPKIESLLNDVVILFDPSLNPDGLQRFAYWANTNRNMNLTADPNDREYSEVWPGGRTNHYWFDMNRDWLPVQLPESRARIETYHQWLPNILTDHHEMGTNSTFFFQPGVPERVHPLTPKKNQELTLDIAQYHIKALDNIGSLYYAQESFDDYYYGKGSTFPDINGGIGILFEQGSSRGHIQESDNGLLTFAFTIRNQFVTALSTLEAAQGLRTELLTYQRDFYKNVRTNNAKNKTKAYVFGDEKDAAKTFHLAEVLNRHKIEVHEVANDFTQNGKKFKKGYSYIVPTNQKNSTILQAMFEKRTTFQDSLFYDISGWTFPYAFNVDYAELSNLQHAGGKIENLTLPNGVVSSKSNYAYIFEWHEYYTPEALYKILDKGIRAKVGKTPFTLQGTTYDYGTIMIPVQNQLLNSDELYTFLQDVAKESHLNIRAVSTGFSDGIDLGSNDFITLKLPKIGIITGSGITSYDAGETWHLLAIRYNMPISKLDLSNFNRLNLDKDTTIILHNSFGGALDETAKRKLQTWVRNGGTLIGYRNAANWLSENDFMNLEFRKKDRNAENISYENRNKYSGAQVTGGALFETKIDRSHPINFGYKNTSLALFRNTNIYIEPNKNSYNNPIQYSNSPLISGYISEENLELLKGAVPFQVQRMGNGKVAVFTDNTNFRAFWFGTNKLLMNAIFFADMM